MSQLRAVRNDEITPSVCLRDAEFGSVGGPLRASPRTPVAIRPYARPQFNCAENVHEQPTLLFPRGKTAEKTSVQGRLPECDLDEVRSYHLVDSAGR
jgi:hypothetical protein